MLRLIAISGVLAFLGACSSGGGCDGGDKKSDDSGQSTSLAGGASSHGGGGEAVSFQGLGQKVPDGPAQTPQAARTASAASALGGSAAAATAPAGPPQSVICGGFPNLAADCKTDPAFEQVRLKCCPTGQVNQCQAFPGGARLVGRGCTATAAAPAAAK